MKYILQKAKEIHNLSKEEIVKILSVDDFDDELFLTANKVRKKFVGNEIHLRALIEFSNICSQNCCYCGIRRDNKKIQRYRIEPDEIIEIAKKAASLGFKTIVLQSGEDAYFNIEKLSYIVESIKKLDVAITLSIGEKTLEEYQILKNAGADRFLIRIETTDEKLYKKNHPNMSYQNRLKAIKNIKKAGFEVGTGILIGLPDQTIDSIADDILFFKKINADMIGLGPFIPAENTPLETTKHGDFNLSIKVLALTRLFLPDINIPATTAMETLHPNGRKIALQAGANVIMPNLTDEKYKKLYNIYPNKAGINVFSNDDIEEIKKQLNTIGRTISTDYGFRKTSKYNKIS